MAVVSDQPARVEVSPPDTQYFFANLRQREFSRLDDSGHTYLDYTGAALYPTSLISRHHHELRQSILGNPHSINPASENSAAIISRARQRVLAFFSADPQEYAVIFTANATAAIKLVAEGFPFNDRSEFLLMTDNHNSVNGVREYARARGATVRYCPVDHDLGLQGIERELRNDTRSPSLFAYPAQSNFSGIHHSLDYIADAQRAGYTVLLDAAAYVPANPLDLSTVHPDFVCVSFYKMFGYPTGIGALVARKQSLSLLRRPWFSGGTVDFVSTQHQNIHKLTSDEHAFEDGSPNFTSVQGVIDGLSFLDDIGLSRIQVHTARLMNQLIKNAGVLKHGNGEAIVRWYGGPDLNYGSARAFNLVDQTGKVVPYDVIEALAGDAGISLRGGCFCNPGCAETAFVFPPDEALRCMERLSDGQFSPSEFASCLGSTEVGALRVSLGMANNEADIRRFVSFIAGLRNQTYVDDGSTHFLQPS